MFEQFNACEPLREIPENYKAQFGNYKTWNDIKLPKEFK